MRLREKLWFRPLVSALLSVLAAFAAMLADGFAAELNLPEIKPDSLESLLSVISASMLGIAVFAVGAMISAYASATTAATPRSFPLVLRDDVSQNALSAFIGAFIFSIVAQVALQNGVYGRPGRFVLFVITLGVFALVILRFVGWVDRIARLGRMGNTVDRVETATARALQRHAFEPLLGGVPLAAPLSGPAVPPQRVGYVQDVDLACLQKIAQRLNTRIHVAARPGRFVAPGSALAQVDCATLTEDDARAIQAAFAIGGDRTFDADPRFGLIVLSEISSRALSPAVNDPGTAIDILGTLVRLFAGWAEASAATPPAPPRFDRIAVPDLALDDLLTDAFGGTLRDGAGCVEVAIHLQKALAALTQMGHPALARAARDQADYALSYAEASLKMPQEIEAVRAAAMAVGRV
ncbi:DUF2254 domain-containing protein [Amphibiibacter pelophylacis]|uniref:DUF2254 domain-containing protein n=1 Tax=Amphibiibacter pelophylacis TaxID=1799477 RepID=A0ACC6P005_9BURK